MHQSMNAPACVARLGPRRGLLGAVTRTADRGIITSTRNSYGGNFPPQGYQGVTHFLIEHVTVGPKAANLRVSYSGSGMILSTWRWGQMNRTIALVRLCDIAPTRDPKTFSPSLGTA
jgi:hypothetical protein